MIEIEKKFKLSGEQEARLLAGAEELGEKTFTDFYYDNAQFSLGLQDIWLRERDGQWELKLPLTQNGSNSVDQYREIEGEMAIREIFALPPLGSFVEDISRFGYEPYCECTTTRRKYRKDGFVIDLDEAVFAGTDLSYTVAEIELLVARSEEAGEAAGKILDFAGAHGLIDGPVRGKVETYLKKEKPRHYAALVEAGVL